MSNPNGNNGGGDGKEEMCQNLNRIIAAEIARNQRVPMLQPSPPTPEVPEASDSDLPTDYEEESDDIGASSSSDVDAPLDLSGPGRTARGGQAIQEPASAAGGHDGDGGRRRVRNRRHRILVNRVDCNQANCTGRFRSMQTFTEHLRSRHGLPKHPCLAPGCRERFDTIGALIIHNNHNHIRHRIWTCALCPPNTDIFPDQLRLSNHMALAHIEGEFGCDVCPFTAITRWEVKTHFRAHNGPTRDARPRPRLLVAQPVQPPPPPQQQAPTTRRVIVFTCRPRAPQV